MGFIDAVVFGADRPVVVAECRRCGTAVDPDASACPTCPSEDIVTYSIR